MVALVSLARSGRRDRLREQPVGRQLRLIASMAGVHNGMTAHKALTQGMTSINNGREDLRVFSEAKARHADVKQACGSQ